MTSTDLAVREEAALTLIDSGEFEKRVAPLLPDTVPVRRFLQVAKTAIRTNPDLANADQRTLMGSLIRCAQDGLVPDGREAALNIYNTKRGDEWVKSVQYLPMIGGLRKHLAEYGWILKTRVVHANDEFAYSEEPQQIRHVPVRPGAEPGDRVAVYAVATHRDGRRLQIVLTAADVEKRKAKAKTDKVWKEWPEAMWEKSAGHAIFDEIPRAERDRMILPADNGAEEAAELLYGPDDVTFTATPVAGDGTVASGVGQQDEPPAERPTPDEQGGSSPDPADDPEPQPAAASPETEDETDEKVAAIVDVELVAATIVPGQGAYAGKTLAQVAVTDDGREWMTWALRNKGRLDPDFHAALTAYVEARKAAERQAAA